MTINTNCVRERKLMVKRLVEHLGVQAIYLGVPSCGYRLGDISVDRAGTIGGNPETLKRIVPFLLEQGYISDATALREDSAANASTESVTTATEVQPDSEADREESIQDNIQDAEKRADDADAEEVDEHDEAHNSELNPSGITRMCVSIPLAELTASALSNILKLIYARQPLIAAMTQSNAIYLHEELMDLLQDERPDTVERICELLQGEIHADMVRGIEIQEGRLSMSFPHDEAQPTRWMAYADLLTAVVNRAKIAHHISGKRLDPEGDEMKYFCRNWLIQLGLGGAAHKETQHILLGHLKGFAAFRSTAKMDAHKAKYAALRKERREEKPHDEN